MCSSLIGTLRSLGLLLLSSLSLFANEPPQEIEYHQKTLLDAKIPLTGEGLLKFFRSRTPSKAEVELWKLRIKELGASDYRTREKASLELTKAGWPAITYLQRASNSTDAEVALRAKRCIAFIRQTPNDELLIAAASVTAQLKPEGAVQAILDYLPHATAQYVRDALHRALVEVDLNDSEVSKWVIQAARDKDPMLRAAAAHVLAQAAPEQRKLAFDLLDDPNITVRFAAAMELTLAHEKKALPYLIELLKEANRAQCYQIEDVLYHLASDEVTIPPLSSWEVSDRRKYARAWLTWWKVQGKKIDLARLERRGGLLGVNLIIEYISKNPSGQGRVFECGRDGIPSWEITTVNYPTDAKVLPDGNVLIAEFWGMCVTIRDRKGRAIWKHQLGNYAVACQQLRNGNIFVAYSKGLMEITPAKKVVYDINAGATVYHGMKLRNGNILFAQVGGQIVEMDTKGNIVHRMKIPGMGSYSSVEQLSNDRYLIAGGSGNKVMEVDKEGKIHWEWTGEDVRHATRLVNGNTLISCLNAKTVYEVNRSGKVVWEMTTKGRSFRAYRR